MQIHFSVKQLGKKQPFIEKQSLEIEGEYGISYQLKNILSAIVKQQVEVFNQRQEEKNLLGFLSNPEMKVQVAKGKVSFGAVYNTESADPSAATETVLQAFEDGLIAVFLDDKPLNSLSEEITLTPESVFTFLRLTFLTGSFW